MEKLYSYKGAYPYPLPSDMTRYDISDFILAGSKPEISNGQVLEWDGTEWSVREANQAEIELKWQEIRDIRKALLIDTDTKILRYLEVGNPVPTTLVEYRQSLRDIPQGQSDPFNIIWPTE